MKFPASLSKQHILRAIQDLDEGYSSRFGSSRRYDLVYEGRHYPPKAVLGRALAILAGDDAYRNAFSGGEPTNRVLRNLGFEVVEKQSG